MDREEDELWYPDVRDVLTIHTDIVEEDPDTTPGVRDEERIEFAIDYVKDGHFGTVPSTIHEKAFHLMRLIASNHWFADGNKRTALNTTEVFYRGNGYELAYGDDVRLVLKLFSVRQELVNDEAGPEHLRDSTIRVEPPDEFEEEVSEPGLRTVARRARDEHRDVYDALAEE